jgi:NAD(P)-dependent dehydrogenase (short-subunit alcohol dehydrogenase family)
MRDIKGKIIVITGASAGTGAAAARELHRLGASVVPIGRSADKTSAVASELGVRSFTVNFLSLDDVQHLADDLIETLPRIDVLALNAGAIVPNRCPTVDGIEPTIQVNALGPWLLMCLLAPRLRAARVISTSSHSHVRAKLNSHSLDRSLDDTNEMRPHDVYARAKLVFGVLLREFGRRTPEITVADFHPGIIASDFGRYMGVWGAVLAKISRPFLATPEDGAQRLVHLATTDSDINGHYFVDNRPAAGSPLLNDRDLAAALWDLAEQRCAKYT